MNGLVTLAEGTGATTVDLSAVITEMGNQMLTGVNTTVTALTPVIVTCVLISVAVHAFKKYVHI